MSRTRPTTPYPSEDEIPSDDSKDLTSGESYDSDETTFSETSSTEIVDSDEFYGYISSDESQGHAPLQRSVARTGEDLCVHVDVDATEEDTHSEITAEEKTLINQIAAEYAAFFDLCLLLQCQPVVVEYVELVMIGPNYPVTEQKVEPNSSPEQKRMFGFGNSLLSLFGCTDRSSSEDSTLEDTSEDDCEPTSPGGYSGF